jgi:hypothetical protein
VLAGAPDLGYLALVHVDPSLKEFAASGAPGERRSVLIEPRTSAVAPPARAPGTKRAKASAKASRDDGFESVARQLGSLDVEVVRLALVGTLVAQLTPEQLRRVMTWPEVAALRENRSHRSAPAESQRR